MILHASREVTIWNFPTHMYGDRDNFNRVFLFPVGGSSRIKTAAQGYKLCLVSDFDSNSESKA